VSEALGSLLLSWLPNTDSDLAGYKLYAGRATGTYNAFGYPIDVGGETSYTVTVADTGSWFFAVTAYDTSDNESGFSSEVEVEFENLKFICV
jgi:hypothetical protein